MSKRVYCLYRVSTQKQVIEDDIPMQKQFCREFAARQQDWQIVKEFSEKNVSGFKVSAEDRDAIQEIRQAALEKKFDILLVYMFDRLGRREDETPFVLKWFVDNGIEVWSAIEGQQRFDNHTDSLLNFIRFWQAQGESIKTSIRTKTRLGQIVQEGHFRGGHVPYGYRLEKQGRVNRLGNEVNEILIDEQEAEVVRRIFELASHYGYGGRKIASLLAEEGIYNRNGEHFHYSTIQNILKNILYTGVLRSGESYSEPFPHLQIISSEQFEQVQEQLKGRRSKYEESRPTPMRRQGTNLLSGNIFCGSCGGRMFGTTVRKTHHPTKNGGHNVRVPVYKCYNRTQHKEACPGQTVYQAKDIDGPVSEAIMDVLRQVKLTDTSEYLKERRKKELAAIRTRLVQLEKEYRSHLEEQQKLSGYILKALEGEGPFTAEDLKSRMDYLKKKCAEISDQITEQKSLLTQAEHKSEKAAAQLEQLRGYAEVFEKATPEERRMIASALIERVAVYPGYELDVKFRVGIDSLAQLPEGESDNTNSIK
jgi:DNA invertase Pin-like site-specific DNA recombinase